MNKKGYIERLLKYTKENNISLYDYYLRLAKHIRYSDNYKLQDFEKQNPFIKQEDIGLLYTSTDDKVVEYFAKSMTERIEGKQEKTTKEEIEELLDEELSDSKLVSISRKIADKMNGFAVVREDKTNRVHLYYHDAKTNVLTGEEIYLNNSVEADSGYYVNYEDYIDNMLDELMNKYPESNTMTFIRDDGLVRPLREVLEEAYDILRQRGAMRFGQDLFKETINSFADLKKLDTNYTEDYAGEPLRVGVYVRRDLVTRIFDKYKVKVEYIENKNTIKK
ncbi:MAG: hypothetical protein IKQ06_04615 [Bacilli bacterium]|nr:hypothetical protein [Bacilli bacterium]MBR6137420.1 hypothetical protein [Bacilli bacterium]